MGGNCVQSNGSKGADTIFFAVDQILQETEQEQLVWNPKTFAKTMKKVSIHDRYEKIDTSEKSMYRTQIMKLLKYYDPPKDWRKKEGQGPEAKIIFQKKNNGRDGGKR